MNKICWIIISAIIFVLLLPFIFIGGILLVCGIYIQCVKDFWKYELTPNETDDKENNMVDSKRSGLYNENY